MHVIKAGGLGFGDAPGRFGQEIRHLRVDHAANGFMDPATPGNPREFDIHFGGVAREQAHLPQLFKGQHPGSEAVIDIVVVVGDFVGEVADLRLQRGAAIDQKALTQLA
jgi:hypothetical protein